MSKGVERPGQSFQKTRDRARKNREVASTSTGVIIMSRIKDDRIRFRGVCLDGPLKGKEIEGKLNIELDLELIKSSRPSSDSGFGSVVVILFLLLGINYVAVKGTDFTTHRPTEASTPQGLPQYGESQFILDDSN